MNECSYFHETKNQKFQSREGPHSDGSRVISENQRELKKLKEKVKDESSAKELLWTRLQLGNAQSPFSLSQNCTT